MSPPRLPRSHLNLCTVQMPPATSLEAHSFTPAAMSMARYFTDLMALPSSMPERFSISETKTRDPRLDTSELFSATLWLECNLVIIAHKCKEESPFEENCSLV